LCLTTQPPEPVGRVSETRVKAGVATLPVKGVVKGWTEVLQLMPVGSKWQVFIPPNLAYAERGSGAVIGPDATLIFEIELVAIK
jgi:FKBP-type peptidyl-prolyl cis-trans isomerase FklB